MIPSDNVSASRLSRILRSFIPENSSITSIVHRVGNCIFLEPLHVLLQFRNLFSRFDYQLRNIPKLEIVHMIYKLNKFKLNLIKVRYKHKLFKKIERNRFK